MAKVKKNTRGKAPSKASQTAAVEVEQSTAVIPRVAKGALQKDIGPMVIAGFAKVNNDTEAATAMMQGARAKSYDLQSALTFAIFKAATADKNIDLTKVYAEDNKAKSYLNNQLGVALGFKEVVNVKGREVLTYAKAVQQFFPQQGVEKDSEEYKRASTFRTNWSHRLTQCIQVAAGIMAEGHVASIDKETKTLRLAGPGIKKQFGSDSVMLNEKQTQENKKGEDVKLKEKPSFTAIAVKAGEKIAGKIVQRGGHGTNRGRVAVDPAKAIAELAKGVVAAIEKLIAPYSEDTVNALRSMANAMRAKVPQALTTAPHAPGK